VRALFGTTSSSEQTKLSVLVAAAVAWPLLVAGIVAPKLAALLLAFVPLPHWVPSWVVRLVWAALALIVPLALGIAVANRAPPGVAHESALRRLLRGFPITIGLAAAFLVMFVSVPVLRFAAMVRRQKSADIPLITDTVGYHQAAALIVKTLNRHGFDFRAGEPGWWVKAPIRILSWFGGAAFSAYAPQQLEHYQSPDLTLSFYPSGLLLRGRGPTLTLAHGLIAEAATLTPGLQTSAAAAQKLEREIHRLWMVHAQAPEAHDNATMLLSRLDEMIKDLSRLEVDFDDWQTLYRQLLQLERQVRGGRQLLEVTLPAEETREVSMVKTGNEGREAEPERVKALTEQPAVIRVPGQPPPLPPQALSVPALVNETVQGVAELARAEVALAKAELRADLKTEGQMVAGLGLSALAAMLGFNGLVVTVILVLARFTAPWLAALIVAMTLLVVGALIGVAAWRKRVRDPLKHTRETLSDDVKWTKERLA
jgi:uncharacterized membrane protein YqjE